LGTPARVATVEIFEYFADDHARVTNGQRDHPTSQETQRLALRLFKYTPRYQTDRAQDDARQHGGINYASFQERIKRREDQRQQSDLSRRLCY
jgi:hypothetical protein